jgi:tetratricopeptide (TPR) repeat protein
MSLDSYEARDEHFQKSIAAMNRNTESLFASAMINLRQGFSYKACPIVEELKKADSSRFFYTTALANFYAANNWNNELAKISESFTNIGYPSRALYYTAVAHIQDNEYGPALDSLEKLYMFDSSNYEAFTKLRQAIEYSAKPERSLSVIQGMAGRRPNDISLLLMLASYIERLEGEQKAIPTLSAALKRSPNNSETLYRIGMVYHKTGKKDLAVFYLNESIKRNPSNHALKQYLDFLHGRDNILAGEIWNGEISELEAESDSTWKNQTAVYLLNEQVFCVNKDISYEKYVRCIVKIYDDIAVDDFNNQYIVYEPGIDFIENIRCRVINGAEISDITDRYTKQLSDPESRLYYNLEAVMIPVSDLKRGSILDFSYTLKNTGAAEYRNAFSETFYPGGSYPMVLYHAALSHPDSAKIYSFTRDIDSSKIKKEKRNGRIFYNAEFDTLEAYKHETAMPPRSEILPALYFSSYKDWDAFASWYRSLLKDKIIISDEMKKDLDALISRNDTPQEKVRKIYNHVTDSIRYVGFELGIGALQPRSTDKTYRTRMGDCKDIALVLAAFLREAGIDASIALVETRNKGTVNLNVPSIGEFNHAICYADIDGGIFLDGTRDKTSYLEMASNERNVNALVINEKTWRFVKTENPKYAPNVDNVTTIIDLKNDGSAVIKRTIEKHGDPAADARESLDDIAKKEQSTTEYWNKFFPGAAVSGLTVISSSRDNPVHYAYDVSITNFASKAEKELIFSPFPDESKYYLSYAMNSSRKFPIEVAGEFLSKSALRINLPPGCKPINLPKDKTIKHALFEVSFVYSCADGIISINSELRIKTYRIPPENYADFRAMARSIQEEESRKIILEMD